MIASTQITNAVFAFVAVLVIESIIINNLVIKLLSRKDLFINRKDNRNC